MDGWPLTGPGDFHRSGGSMRFSKDLSVCLQRTGYWIGFSEGGGYLEGLAEKRNKVD